MTPNGPSFRSEAAFTLAAVVRSRYRRPGALIAQQAFFSELVADNPLMSALEPASGLLGKEYAKETEAAPTSTCTCGPQASGATASSPTACGA